MIVTTVVWESSADFLYLIIIIVIIVILLQPPKYRMVTVSDLIEEELEVGSKVQGRYQNKWLVSCLNGRNAFLFW